MSRKLYKIKILLIVAMIVLIMLVIFLKVLIVNKNNNYDKLSQEYRLELDNDINIVENKYIKEMLNEFIGDYLYYLKNKNYDALYKLLDKQFRENNKINKDNIYDYFNYIETYKIERIYELQIESDLITYFVYGKNENQENYNIIVNVDYGNSTYSICPYGYMYRYGVEYSTKEGPEVKDINIIRNEYNRIEVSEYNKF